MNDYRLQSELVNHFDLPLLFLSSNQQKKLQLEKSKPDAGIAIHTFTREFLEGGLNPLIDEKKIKAFVEHSGIDPMKFGISYAIAVSQGKIEMFRARGGIERIREGKAEAVDANLSNGILISSDAVLLIPRKSNKSFMAVNRDDSTPEAIQEAIALVNQERELMFIGALSYSPLAQVPDIANQRIASVVSYFRVRLAPGATVDEMPVPVSKMTDSTFINLDIPNGGGYDVGYIFQHQEAGENSTWEFSRHMITPYFDEGSQQENSRPYISGVTPLSLSTIYEASILRGAGFKTQVDTPRAPIISFIPKL